MTVKELIVLGWAGHIFLYFFLPWLKDKVKEHRDYKQRLLDDNVELARMIKEKENANRS